jgi:four helix bundle protein
MRDQDATGPWAVKSFRDLIVWQRSMQLCVAVYELTRTFPREEIYGLTSQMRRACVSISSNIAEGHGRGSVPQLLHFLSIARGSTFEVQAQLLLARELQLGEPAQLDRSDGFCEEISKMLFATMKSLKSRQSNPSNTSPDLSSLISVF